MKDSLFLTLASRTIKPITNYLLFFIFSFVTIPVFSQQWVIVDQVNFNGLPYGSDYVTNGSPYYDNSNPTPQMIPPGSSTTTGPYNGVINTQYEVNGGLSPSGTVTFSPVLACTTQSPSDAAGGRCLMFWTDDQYPTYPTFTCPEGYVWCRSYSGLVVGQTYRYSYKSASVNGASPLLDIYINGAKVGKLNTVDNGNWKTTYYEFIAQSSQIDICIYNSRTTTQGNDLFLDDITLETFSFLNCVNTNTTNYPLVNGSNSVDPASVYDILGLINTGTLANVVDNTLTDAAVRLTNDQYVAVGTTNPNSSGYSNLNFPSGYFAGFVLDVIGHWNNSQHQTVTTSMVTITTYLNGIVQETKTGTDLTVLPGFNSTTQNIGFYTTTKFNGIRIALSGMTGGNATAIYYANAAPPSCGNPLPIVFTKFDAFILNGILTVNWSTQKDLNTDHFVVEASYDGTNFKKIGEVQPNILSDASTSEFNYTYKIQNSQLASIFGGLFFILLAFSFFNRKNKALISMTAIAAISLSIFFIQSCKKSDAVSDKAMSEKMFVRVGEVDKSGNLSYSKVIEVKKID